MPYPEIVNLRQKAVLWRFAGYLGNGDEYVGDPEEISVRWESAERESTGPDRSPDDKNATVYVDQIIPLHSHLWLGQLEDLPDDPTDVFIVTDSKTTPDIKNRRRQRTLTVVRCP